MKNSGEISAREGRTANAVIVFRVFGLICAGMNARMKFGTLHAYTRHRGNDHISVRKRRREERMRVARYGRGDVERSKDCQKEGRQSLLYHRMLEGDRRHGRETASGFSCTFV